MELWHTLMYVSKYVWDMYLHISGGGKSDVVLHVLCMRVCVHKWGGGEGEGGTVLEDSSLKRWNSGTRSYSAKPASFKW